MVGPIPTADSMSRMNAELLDKYGVAPGITIALNTSAMTAGRRDARVLDVGCQATEELAPRHEGAKDVEQRIEPVWYRS